MSAESLEDGEIASEHEPSPELGDLDVDVNDELEIDQIIENENNQSTSSQRIINSPAKSVQEDPGSSSSRRRSRQNSNKQQRGRYRYQQNSQNQAPPPGPPPSLMATSWHPLGNGQNTTPNGQGGHSHRQIRQPPSEAVIFGIQNPPTTTPTPEQFLQPPPQINQQMMVSPDITRLQNIVNHQREYYPPPPGIHPPPRVPYQFFQSPPPQPPQHHQNLHLNQNPHHQNHQMRTPLMSLAMSQRPLPHLAPHPPPQMLQNLSSPSNLQPSTSSSTSWRNPNNNNDNYEQINMEMSPEEPPPAKNDPFVKPPVQIPLEAVVTSTTSNSTPEAQKKAPEAPRASGAPEEDSEEAKLRALLLASMNPGGKRPTSSASGVSSAPSGAPEPKKIRKNSAPRLSSSVEQVFGAKPVQPPPPVPKIQVNIGRGPMASEAGNDAPSAPESTLAAPEAPESAPEALEALEDLPRDQKREQLEKRMREVEALFQTQKSKVSEAGKNSKVAATMAAKAEQLAKQAEKMNQEAVELRQKCIEDARLGKEEMKRILEEKRALQTAIDEMSIDDMEEIDVEDFPCIFFASVKRDDAPKPLEEPKDEKPDSSQLSSTPPTPQTPKVTQNGAPPAAAAAPSHTETPKAPRGQIVTSSVAPTQKSTTLAQNLTSSGAPVAPEQRLTSSRTPIQNSPAPAASTRHLAAPESPRTPRIPEVVKETRQEGGRNEHGGVEQVQRRELAEHNNEHDDSEDMEEEEVDEEEEQEQEQMEMEHSVEVIDEEAEEEEEIEGEDEYETDEEEEQEEVSNAPEVVQKTSASSSSKESEAKAAVAVPPQAKKIEEEMRARLLNKFSRNDTSRKSPDADKVTSSTSQSTSNRAEECRAVLHQMCKFELNGKCERPRDCQFLHMHKINDAEQQKLILEGLFRDVFQYQESDIEPAVTQTMYFLPQLRSFEKLMDQFFKVVIQRAPDYKTRLFQFFAANRR